MKKIIVLLLFNILFAQEKDLFTFTLKNPIVVSAARFPVTLLNSARTVTVLDSSELAELPAYSIQDALEYVAGVDILQRGAPGVQGDVNLRGAGYEQILVLVNGLNVNDPQTGHHNLNIAFPLSAVERIEVVKGAGSRLFGPGAMGGIINIITRKSKTTNGLFSISGGDFQFTEVKATVDLKGDHASHSLNFNRSSNSGYQHNTDFTNYAASYQGEIKVKDNRFSFTGGFNSKDFGANRFYHPAFVNQREKTKTFFLSTQGQIYLASGKFTLMPELFWRHQDDDFVLDYKKPDWYHNKHRTDILGLEISGRWVNKLGRTALQVSPQLKKIESNNLGSHEQRQVGISVEHQTGWRKWQFILGSSFYYFENWGWQFNPGLDVAFQASPNWTLYFSGAKGFRPPSFTELYYDSPANKGNPFLKSEESVDFEIGSRWQTGYYLWSVALFQRLGRHLIDWQFAEAGQYWQARNVARLNMAGIELSAKFVFNHLFFRKIELNYTYLKSNKAQRNYISKYVLNYLKHQANLMISQNLGSPRLLLQWQVRYQNRLNYKDYFVTDVHFQWRFKKILFFSDITNLFNQRYEDITAVPLPSRWFKAGIKVKIKD